MAGPGKQMVSFVAAEGAFVSPGISVRARVFLNVASDVPVPTELGVALESDKDSILGTCKNRQAIFEGSVGAIREEVALPGAYEADRGGGVTRVAFPK
jgi:hypothetical protein